MLLNWNYEKLKQITNGTNNINIKNFKVTGFSIDSRSINKEIFLCTKGKNHEGMTSCFKLIKRASCFLLSDANKNIPNLPYIKVDNVLHALESS